MTRWERFRRLLKIEATNECLRAKLRGTDYEVKVYGPGFDEGLPDAVTRRLSFTRDLW